MMDTELLRDYLWTSGAWRLLQRAGQVAAYHAHDEVESAHLLWALLMDEGRAGSSLAEAGLSTDLLTGSRESLVQTELEQIREADIEARWHPAAVDIVREARHLAHHAGAGDETGTDHLLAAFLSSADPLAVTVQAAWSPARTPDVITQPPEIPPVLERAPETVRVDLELRERPEPNLFELYRILDASANRCREGLRVLEDHARFGVDNSWLTGNLKGIRHELTAILGELPQAALLACRDTPGDVGTALETAREYQRTDLQDVLTAAFKRVQEALRSLEEYSKVISGDLGRRFERLRYRIYTIEKAASRTETNRERFAGQQLYVLLTDAACPGGVPYVLKGALDAGVRLFQVREKSLGDRELLEHCRRVRRWTREAGALLVINDRPDLAVLCEADGVHVGQEELTVADARRVVGPDRLIGVSTHSIEQARQAVLDGADYLGVGPTFPTTTKSFAQFPGLELIHQVAAEISLPWFAIGGIQAGNIRDVVQAGGLRVAVTGAVSQSTHPGRACAELLDALPDNASR